MKAYSIFGVSKLLDIDGHGGLGILWSHGDGALFWGGGGEEKGEEKLCFGGSLAI